MNNILSHDGYRPISLPRMNALLVSTLNALQGKYIALDIGLETWNLCFSGKPGLNAGREATAQAEWQGHRVAARFPQALLHRTLHTCRPDLSLDDIPVSLWPAMTAKLIGAWLTKLPHAQSLHVDKIESHDAADDAVTFVVSPVRRGEFFGSITRILDTSMLPCRPGLPALYCSSAPLAASRSCSMFCATLSLSTKSLIFFDHGSVSFPISASIFCSESCCFPSEPCGGASALRIGGLDFKGESDVLVGSGGLVKMYTTLLVNGEVMKTPVTDSDMRNAKRA
jgi:hypothetical protein